jgi:hypothetical protein
MKEWENTNSEGSSPVRTRCNEKNRMNPMKVNFG